MEELLREPHFEIEMIERALFYLILAVDSSYLLKLRGVFSWVDDTGTAVPVKNRFLFITSLLR